MNKELKNIHLIRERLKNNLDIVGDDVIDLLNEIEETISNKNELLKKLCLFINRENAEHSRIPNTYDFMWYIKVGNKTLTLTDDEMKEIDLENRREC